MRRVAFLLVFLLPAPTVDVGAQAIYNNVLADMGPVKVLVDVYEEYLRPADIRRAAEARLRNAGVALDSGEQKAGGYLFVRVRLYCDPSELCAYSVDLYLDEDVQIFRNGVGLVGAGITWHSFGVIGYVGKEHISEVIADVENEVDVFAEAYLTVNPKK